MSEAMELTKAGTSRKRPPRLGEGAPSTYSKATATEICTRLMDGVSLLEIGKMEDMPNRATIYPFLSG